MNNAIIFIRNDEEKQLVRTPYLGGNLLIHTIRELKKVDEIGDIYVVGAKQGYPGTLKRSNVKDVLKEVEEMKTNKKKYKRYDSFDDII